MQVVVVTNKLPRLSAKVRDAVMDALVETGTEIEQDVKGGTHGHPAPYRTGNLRRSYHMVTIPQELRVEVGNDAGIAPYAPFVELGTRFMAAQPHLLPAAEYQRNFVAERIAQRVDAIAQS